MDEQRNVLVADDDLLVCRLLTDALPNNWRVSVVHTGREAYALLTQCRGYYDLALVDIHMPAWDGDEAVGLAAALGADTPVIYVTGDHEAVQNCGQILLKPFAIDDLMFACHHALADKATYS